MLNSKYKNYTNKLLYSFFALFVFMVFIPFAESSPYFYLSTDRVFAPGEEAKIRLECSDISKLSFRLYKISDPFKFFEEQDNIHSPLSKPEERRVTALEVFNEANRRIKRDTKAMLVDEIDPDKKDTIKEILGLTKDEEDVVKTTVQARPLKIPPLADYELLDEWTENVQVGKSYWWTYKDIKVPVKKTGVYLVEAYTGNQVAYTVVIISKIGFITKQSSDKTLVCVTNRITGEPISGVKLKLINESQKSVEGISNGNGIYLASIKSKGRTTVLGKTNDGEFGIADPYFYSYYEKGEYRVYTYTDRPVYRPAQTVYFKGIVRKYEDGNYFNQPGKDILVTVFDSRGNEIYKNTLKTNDFGTFNGELNLADEPPLGNYRISVRFDELYYEANFKVEEYKKPEFKVTVKTDKSIYSIGDEIKIDVKADYFFGSPVTSASVRYFVYRSKYWTPWWYYYGDEYSWYYSDDEDSYYSYDTQLVESGEGILDENGKHSFSIYAKGDGDEDYIYRIEAKVEDKSRREISGSSSVKVTRGSFNISTYTDKYVYKPGEIMKINIKTLDYSNNPVPNIKIFLKLCKVEWSGGRQNEKEIYSANATTNSAGYTYIDYKIRDEGYIKIYASAVDDKDNRISSENYVWISSSWGYYSYQASGLEIVPDKASYKPGDKAHIMVVSPIKNSNVLITLEADDIYEYKLYNFKGNTQIVEIPITDKYAPNVFVSASFIKDDDFYTKSKSLIVPPSNKFLKIEISADKSEYRPQDEGTITIKTTNSEGKPISAEVSIGIIDESIYSIASESTKDIQKFFYDKRWNKVQTQTSLDFRFYGYSRTAKMRMASANYRKAFELGDFKEGGYKPAKVRQEFKDAILWLPTVVTNIEGKAVVKVKYPDNLTTWRTTARAITKTTEVGSNTYNTLVRKNLIVRMETPRFFTQKDELIISTIVHNYLSEDKSAKVSLTATGADVLDSGERTISVPKNGEKRVDWRIKVPSIGNVVLSAKGLTNEESDAMQLTIPVLPHGTKIAKAVASEISTNQGTALETLTLPTDSNKESAELYINLSPSIASAMLSSLEYLIGYPYGCVEQTMSRFLPTVIVANTLKDMNIKVSENIQKEIPKMIDKGFKQLMNLQHSDGGWGWWQNDENNPYMTAYVVYGLSLAKRAGYSVPQKMYESGVKSLLSQLSDKEIDATTRAYMVFSLSSVIKTQETVMSLMTGQTFNNNQSTIDVQSIRSKCNSELSKFNNDKINDYARSLLILAMYNLDEKANKDAIQSLVASLKSNVVDVGTMCYWGGQTFHYRWQDDKIETTALAFNAIVNTSPNDELVGKSLRWLVGQRRGNAWRSSKDTAIIILSLVDYLKISKELTPNFTSKIFVNDKLIQEKNFTTADISQPNAGVIKLSSKDLMNGDNVIRIEKQGEGKLYYSARLIYYTSEEDILSTSAGFNVDKEYYRLISTKQNGEWIYKKERLDRNAVVKSGDIILVKLKVNSGASCEYFMFEDPLPAGCEVIKDDRNFIIEGERDYSRRDDYYYYDYYWDYLWAQKDIRDEKVAFFITELPAGVNEMTYLMRAQIPGKYHIMPGVASVMYYPEMMGNSTEIMLQVVE